MEIFLFFHSTSVNKHGLNAATSDQSIFYGGVNADKAGLVAPTEQIIALPLKSCVWREGCCLFAMETTILDGRIILRIF